MDDSTENMNFDDAPVPDNPPDDLSFEESNSSSRSTKRSVENTVPGRVPPHALDVEAALLGTMLLSRDAIADALQIVEPEHF